MHLLVLAGGAGTRFWPASRRNRPKQLLPLGGGEALLVETVRRVLPLAGGDPRRVLVATGAHLLEATAALLPSVPRDNLLVEPVPRNTAPCIAWAAARVARTAPDEVIAVLPSDHHVADETAFREVLACAARAAESGAIVTIGVSPTRAETGYGYIELAAAATDVEAVPVARFVEKPDRARAEAFVASGRFLWNAGMFVFRARDLVDAVRTHLPALAAGLDEIDAAARAGREVEAISRVFPSLPSVSIDVGVMERMPAERIRVVPGDFGWSDVGGWTTAWELSAKDGNDNHAPDSAVLVDAHRNHVVDLREPSAAARRVIALVGVDDLVVVETDDALLIVPRSRAEDVRSVVDALRARGDADRT